jgi:hypothetical protein
MVVIKPESGDAKHPAYLARNRSSRSTARAGWPVRGLTVRSATQEAKSAVKSSAVPQLGGDRVQADRFAVGAGPFLPLALGGIRLNLGDRRALQAVRQLRDGNSGPPAKEQLPPVRPSLPGTPRALDRTRPGRRMQDRLGDQGPELLKGFRRRETGGRHGADDVLALRGRQMLELLPDGLGTADLQ